jgi:hypothetical protein
MAEPGSDSLDRLIAAFGPRFDELRAILEELSIRWRGDALRVGRSSRASSAS